MLLVYGGHCAATSAMVTWVHGPWGGPEPRKYPASPCPLGPGQGWVLVDICCFLFCQIFLQLLEQKLMERGSFRPSCRQLSQKLPLHRVLPQQQLKCTPTLATHHLY